MKGFVFVILSIAVGIVFATLNGLPHYYHFVSMVSFFLAGYFANEYKIWRVK